MQLIELELSNIKSYTEAVISFTEGINGIAGPNGAGKSTIREALGFALFDSSSPKASSLLRQGKRAGSIRVRFLHPHDGHTYEVVRYLGRRLAYVHNCDEDYRVCEGQRDVRIFLQQAMGASSPDLRKELFQHAIGVPQGNFQSPFLETPAVRKAHFGPLLNVSKYRDAYKGLLSTEKYIREIVHEQEVQLARLDVQLEKREDKEQEFQDLEQTAAALRQQIQDQEDRLRALADQIGQLEEAQAKLQATQGQHDQTQLELGRTTQELQVATANLQEARKAHDAVKHNQPDHDRYLAAEHALNQVRQKQDKHRTLQTRTAHIAAEQSMCQERHQALAAQMAELESLRQEAVGLADEAEQYGTAERELYGLTVTADSLAEAQANLAAVKTRLQQNAAEHEQVTTQLAQGTRLRQQAEREDSKAAQAAASWSTLDRERIRLQTRLDSLTEQEQTLHSVSAPADDAMPQAICPICQQPLSPDQQHDLLAQNHHATTTVQRELTDLERQLGVQTQAQTASCQAAAGLRADASQLQNERDLDAVEARRQILLQEQTQRTAELAATQQDWERKQHLQALADRLLPGAERYRAIEMQLASAATIPAEREEWASRLQRLEQELQQCQLQEAEFAGLEEQETQLRAGQEASRSGYELVIAHTERARSLEAHRLQFETLQAKHASLQTKIKELETSLADRTLAYDAAWHMHLRQEQETLRTELTRAETRYEDVEENRTKLQAELQTLAARAQQRVEVHQEHTVRKRREEHLVYLRNLLNTVQPQITAALIEQISQEANQFFCQLMNDHTRHLCWTEDFGIQLRVGGEKLDYQQLSGGEQMTAALAVILALLRSLSNVQFAFFDEPTINLDEERRAELAQRIREIRGFRQLFLISHDDTFAASLDNVIHIRKENNVSRLVTNPTD